MLEKVLIANRGEIAVRILTACQELGIKTVAIYSDVDANSPHVRMADEAYCLGDPEPRSSYLNVEKIIAAAREMGADAIHPGYGFLAENPEFAQRCEREGIVFVGPRSEVIRLMGHKVEAKSTIKKAGVPVIPGYHGGDQEIEALAEEGLKIGFPLLIKAASGGGGKGMRIVRKEEELREFIESCKRESLKAFGDETVFLEKYLDRPRHIEFQVLGDHHDHMIHLFERECSIQRRHQKIIEETPSPAMDPSLRETMGKAATRAAEAVGYTNAGTVEFMVDAEKNFYFLEMNTRLQVEHPVTEYVTGVDLVKWQLRIASGQPLTLNQATLAQRGHALECRIYAEDPHNEFLPSTGIIHYMELPEGINIRNDSGIEPNVKVTSYYDPLLAKLTVYAETRNEAIEKMMVALSNYVVLGVTTNVSFLRRILAHPDFREGNITTHFIDDHKEIFEETEIPDEALISAAMAEKLRISSQAVGEGATSISVAGDPYSPWKSKSSWSNV
ncbi:MAG: acetyl-CoA carboxylase biotin carboxylase subunit [Theionarchaea archaeon]|nr:acetyl-CoA carboxylase biotin carboxylase subunit [Theionarchaea archaeon]MBU6999948.1 acetyl-CoA carboxylase biotin carboxylase subunit [Theionarchaea archaeon]MBU7041267.1 acetyl-CoA carboxylase biotin carboxylase subunit [Theionarchaea archaeon]